MHEGKKDDECLIHYFLYKELPKHLWRVVPKFNYTMIIGKVLRGREKLDLESSEELGIFQ